MSSSRSMTTRSMSSMKPEVSKPKSLFETFESLIKKDKNMCGVFDYIQDNKLFPDEKFEDKDYSGGEYEMPYDKWLSVTGIDKEGILQLNRLLVKQAGWYSGSIEVYSNVVYVSELN